VHISKSSEGSLDIAGRREFDLAVREAELKRREAALKLAERAVALPHVPTKYFDPGHNSNEDDWWAKQLGR
jgi:hypothetical protein